MVKIEILEDGKPMPTEQTVDMDVTVLKKDDQVILRKANKLTAVEMEQMGEALEKFSKGDAKFLVVPHGFKVFVLRDEAPED